VDAIASESFNLGGLGGAPWVLATGDEARVLEAIASESHRLEDVTARIFQGLITGADPIYILEDRGRRGGRQVVYSSASDEELELEPDLLHPLASGVDVDRYAFRPLQKLLLFPYRREDGDMRLLTPAELAELPLTDSYMRRHEDALRARDGGRMDRDGWYALVRTQNLGVHDSQKLGVAATVKHLEIAADPNGAVYFHNVRVNGILLDPHGPSIWTLLVLLNSRLMDWVFRLGATEHANGYYAANRQFIAPLPIRVPGGDRAQRFEELGQRLHGRSTELGEERRGFLAWLGGTIGARPTELQGSTTLASYDEHTLEDVLRVLQRNQSRLQRDVGSRAFREEVEQELDASLGRIGECQALLTDDEATADDAVFELYGLSGRPRTVVGTEGPQRA
jgi:hypothetical protein